MSTQKEPFDLRVRTKKFALRIIQMYRALPKSSEASIIGRQILRSGTSVGAQYREASRAKSPRDFISKMEGSLQELDETAFWIELLIEAEVMSKDRMSDLEKETDELIAIFVSSIKTANKNAK
ncbi:MAG: four helix bundle protein [Anaerolineales bacterium]|uniref:Four helix bundle protein n=1 Tax=Candidatus Desulfolinea nitratireducens TaxID=2841698 RepID=A0A8J6TK81_9CHLR|nr:four helix bundle protein [Candidatus Desulfolinea nitratireducens]MBL6961686.1 four helix bundle protein [Anaerolineales bacterium]